MKHPSEDELIAYALGEGADDAAVRAHVQMCERCAAEADSIAETLRVFSGDRVPAVNVEHAWARLRAGLPALAAAPRKQRRIWLWGVPALVACLLVGLLGWLLEGHPLARRPHGELAGGGMVLRGPGPITAEPTDADTAEHLSSAERLLTEVSHTDGELTGSTRTEAHELLLQNAVYLQRARQRGDLPEAEVLETLGRTLTTLDHEPESTGGGKGWHLRLELNTDGLLLDLRILQQNDRAEAAAGKDTR